MVHGVFSIPLDEQETASFCASNPQMSHAADVRQYIGGLENALAHTAVTDFLDGRHEPQLLVFYGPSGMGNSLLAHGIVQRWKQQFPRTKYVFTTGPDFARALANAIQIDAVDEFQAKFRTAKLAVVDDVNELATKPTAQKEFIHTIDFLIDRGTRIVITCKHHPVETAGLTAA